MPSSVQKSKSAFLMKLILLVGANVALMAGSSLSPAVPAMLSEFSGVPGHAFWVSMIITLPALFVVIGGPLTGFLVDRFGRKPILVAALFLGGLAGSAAFFLNSIGAILVTRALVGFSIAGATTATNALIADYFEGKARAKFMGAQSAFTGLAGVFFLSLGGFLADLNWHFSFLSYVPLLIIFALAWIFIQEPAVLEHDPVSIKSSRLHLSALIIFIFYATFINQFTFMTIPIFFAPFMAVLVNATATQVGLIGAASGLFSFFAGMLYERIGRQISYKGMNLLSFLVFGSGFVALGLARTWTLAIVGELLLGFGMGLLGSNMATWLASMVQPQVRGRANGVFVTMMFLGQFATSLIFTPLVNRTSMSAAFIVSAILSFITAGVGMLFRDKETIQS